MANNPNDIIAAIRINVFTDTLEQSFGVDASTFTIVVTGSRYNIRYSEGVSVFGEQAQLFVHAPAAQNRIVQAAGIVMGTPGIGVSTIDPTVGGFAAGFSPIVVTVQNIFGGLVGTP